MPDGREKAAYYRRRAAELRAIAASLAEAQYRETLLQIARDHDDFAEIRERLARDDPPGEPQSTVTLMDGIRGRRSLRDYVRKPVSRDVLQSLVDAAIQAPSAMNEQPWLFTIIANPKLLDRIAANAKRFMAESIGTDASSHTGAMLHADGFHIFYHAPALIVISAPSNGQWSTEDCALAAQNLMLAAHAKGLSSCWIGFAQSWLGTPDGKRTIGLPDNHTPVAPIIIGHPESIPPAVPRSAPQDPLAGITAYRSNRRTDADRQRRLRWDIPILVTVHFAKILMIPKMQRIFHPL